MGRKFAMLALAAGLLFFGVSCAQPDLSQEMSLAMEAAQAHHYAEAAAHARLCMDAMPDFTDAALLYHYAVFLEPSSGTDGRRQSLYHLGKLTKTDPVRYETWFFYGWALVEERQMREAVLPLETALKLAPPKCPHLPQIRLLLGQCYVVNNLQKKALGILQPLQAKDPYRTWPELYNSLALLALRRQNVDTAVKFFRRGLELSPKNESLLQNLAVTYDLYGNEPDLARKTYLQCLVQKQAGTDEEGVHRIHARIRRLAKRRK